MKQRWLGSVWPVVVLLMMSGVKQSSAQTTQGTMVLTGADRRPAKSLNGEWASIVDPLFLRPLQLSSRREEEWLVPELQGEAGRSVSDRV